MKMSSTDITDMLRDWRYDEHDCIRFFTAGDGREVMQIRRPLGIEQYNMDGRPDGLRPEGEETYLHFLSKRLHKAENTGQNFMINDEECHNLRNEGVLFYFRYLALNQVSQYGRVARDTEHNLKIGRLLELYYPGDKKYEILQYRPYIRRMNGIAKAMIHLASEDSSRALHELEWARRDIESFPTVPTPVFEFEKIRSVQHIQYVMDQIARSESKEISPRGFREKLSRELEISVECEDYERAANIRDMLKDLK